MAVTAMHTLYAVNVEKDGVDNDLFIDEVQDWNIDTGINEILQAADGAVDPTFVSVMGQSPRVRFTSGCIARILAKCGISGMNTGADDTGAICWFQALAKGGTRAVGATHIKLTSQYSLLVPRRLNIPGDGGGPATMELELIPYSSDGATAPVVPLGSQSLTATPEGQAREYFVAGPASVNGTTINGVLSTTIEFGIEEIVQASDGAVFPSFVGIMSRKPSITIRTADVGILATLGLSGAAQTATNSVVYLRKLDAGGTRVADDGSEHISFAVDDGRVSVTGVTGPHGQTLGADVRISPTYDGVAAIFAIDTTADIV